MKKPKKGINKFAEKETVGMKNQGTKGVPSFMKNKGTKGVPSFMKMKKGSKKKYGE